MNRFLRNMFLTITLICLSSCIPVNHSMDNYPILTSLLAQQGYADIEYVSTRRRALMFPRFKCESRVGVKIIGSATAFAVKQGQLRKVTLCFSELSAFFFDPKEVPSGVLVINKEKALEIYQ